jgi:hypothetical protein
VGNLYISQSKHKNTLYVAPEHYDTCFSSELVAEVWTKQIHCDFTWKEVKEGEEAQKYRIYSGTKCSTMECHFQ